MPSLVVSLIESAADGEQRGFQHGSSIGDRTAVYRRVCSGSEII